MNPMQSKKETSHDERPEPARPQHPSYLPFYAIPGLSNFRDIGGWPILSPSLRKTSLYVRRNLIYRGGDTTRITHAGEMRLQALGVKIDFDLRSKQQIEKTSGFKYMEGIERVWVPVFDEETYTEEKARQRYELYAGEGTDGIVQAFMEILIAGAPMYHKVLTRLLTYQDSPSRAIFLHCTTGNNRTGVFIAILLLLLRVSHAAIIHEYTLSNDGLAPTQHVNIKRLLGRGAFAEYGPGEAKRKCERMLTARAESMEALIEEIVRRWGEDGEGYFRQVVGLRLDEIARLRNMLTAEGEGYDEAGGVEVEGSMGD